jgi:hypothetical protein
MSVSATVILAIVLVLRIETVYFDRVAVDSERTPILKFSVGHRIYQVLKAAPTLDLVADLVRLCSIGSLPVLFALAFTSEALLFHAPGVVLTILSLGGILSSSLAYPLLRRQSLWDKEYRYRKALSAHALNYASSTLLAPDADAVYRAVSAIEHDSLAAVKSYLEYSVMDRKRTSFNVNLIVVHPQDSSILACVARTNQEKRVPTFYRREEMTIASRALFEGKPIYIGDFVSVHDKPYRMVWHIPIARLGSSGIQGLVAVDSLVPRHLDLLDEREALLFNLLPYLSLLRFSLFLRSNNRIWHSINYPDRSAEVFQIADFHVDRSIDQASVGVLSGASLESEYRHLRKIADGVKAISLARKAFSVLFPNVDSNNQRLRA